MRKIPVKNYFILLIMIFGVVVVTLAGKKYYNNNLKKVSGLYKYANHINRDELKEYLVESSSLIIYIADKYDLNKEDEEELLKDKIIELNLYNKSPPLVTYSLCSLFVVNAPYISSDPPILSSPPA